MMYLLSGGLLTTTTQTSQGLALDNQEDVALVDSSSSTESQVDYVKFYQGEVYQNAVPVAASTARPSTSILLIALILIFLYAFFFVRRK